VNVLALAASVVKFIKEFYLTIGAGQVTQSGIDPLLGVMMTNIPQALPKSHVAGR
jgi:hypothetical protein